MIQMISCGLLISRYKLSWLQCYTTNWQRALERILYRSRVSSELLCGISCVTPTDLWHSRCAIILRSLLLTVMENSNAKTFWFSSYQEPQCVFPHQHWNKNLILLQWHNLPCFPKLYLLSSTFFSPQSFFPKFIFLHKPACYGLLNCCPTSFLP